MTTKELVGRLVEFGRANSVESLIAAAPYLEALGEAFGEREARSVTARDLHDFHRDVGAELAETVASGLKRKSLRWEAIYSSRSQQLLGCLPWESERPVRALVELFERPGFQPQQGSRAGLRRRRERRLHGEPRLRGDRRRRLTHGARDGPREAAPGRGGDRVGRGRRLRARSPPGQPYDFVFDRGMLHHLQVFQFEDYKNLVADRLAPAGLFHLICHHVSTRPTVVLDGLYGGALGKLLGFLTGPLQ